MRFRMRMKRYFPVILLIAAAVITITGYGVLKQGMFIDEIYSFGLSNSYYTPFVRDIHSTDETVIRLTQKEMFDYLTVNDEDDFAYASVYHNQAEDVHPPLYYMLMHTVSSVFRNTYSKWPGLILNSSLYLGTLALAAVLAHKLFGDKYAVFVTVALYAFSHGGLSTGLMIRMYMLLTLLTVTLAYFVKLCLEKVTVRRLSGVFLSIALGMLTQYYFVMYAFFVCCAAVLYMLLGKRYRDMFAFSAAALLGIAVFVAVFPHVFSHMSANKLVSGSSAAENLLNIKGYIRRILTFVMYMPKEMPTALIAGVLSFAACIVFFRRAWASVCKSGAQTGHMLIIVIPAFAALIAIAVISPAFSSRYIYNLFPIFALAAAWALKTALDSVKVHSKGIKSALCIALCVLSVVFLIRHQPDYIYPEHNERLDMLEEYADSPCIYFSEKYSPPVTQDILYLINFRDVCIVQEPSSEGLREYLDGFEPAQPAIVFVDVNENWSSGYNAEEKLNGLLENTQYTEWEKLYSFGLSETYVVR